MPEFTGISYFARGFQNYSIPTPIGSIMIRNLFIVFIACTFLPVSAQNKHRGFFDDYATALQEANELGQVLMIGFYEKSCFLGKQLNQEVYRSKEFQAITDEIACVKVDIDKDKGGILADKYRISGCPTVLFTNGAGIELERITSYIPKEEFMGIVTRILKGNSIPVVENRVVARQDYSDLFLLSLYFCRNDYHKDKLDKYYMLFKKLDPKNEKDSTNALLQYIYRKEIQRGVGSIAPEVEDYLITSPDGNSYKLAVLLTNYYLKSGDADRAWNFFSDFYMLTDQKSKVESFFQKLKKVTGHEDEQEPEKKCQ